jgi:acyl carrier protein
MTNIDDIRKTVAEVLEVEPCLLQPETNFYDLPNFDSVAILSLIVALDDLGVEIPQHKASEIRTFGDVLALAKSK